MFPQKHRLAKTKDIQQTLARGRSFFNSFYTLKFRKSSRLPRFTVVVSTKVSKKATLRNRIKRVLRDELRKTMLSLPSGDYALLVKPAAAGQLPQLRLKLAELLKTLRP